jgi:predicted MFS family arabinose efflux permease
MGCEDYLFAGLLPGISASLHASVVAVAQGCAVFGLAYILSMPLCAFLLSRVSARRVLIAALALFIAGNATTLLSTELTVYILGRLMVGLGGGLFLPVAVAVGTQLVEGSFRGRALSLMWSFNSAGAVVGVPLGLWLADRMGWRATVMLILILAVFALAGMVIFQRSFRVERPPPSLEEQFRLLTDRRVMAVVGVTLLTATGCLGLYAYMSQVLSGTRTSADVAFSLWSIGGLIGSSAIGYVVDRLRRPQPVMAVILAALCVAVAAIPVLRWIPIFGLWPFPLWGAMGWASVTPQQYVLIETKPGHEAIGVALISSAVSLGSVLGTALGGLALAGGLGAEYLPYLTAIFVCSALALQVFLIPRLFRTAGPQCPEAALPNLLARQDGGLRAGIGAVSGKID